MFSNKHAAKSFEQQHLQRVRKSTHAIIDINIALGDVHRTLHKHIDITPFEPATTYVDQFVSYTTVWNLKFVYNLESPEVAMLQLFHLRYILKHFPEEQFTAERAIVEENFTKFNEVKPFTDDNVANRFEKFLSFASK